MTKFLVQVAFLRFGVRRFRADLNDALQQGWTLVGPIQIHPWGWFRVILIAELRKGESLCRLG